VVPVCYPRPFSTARALGMGVPESIRLQCEAAWTQAFETSSPASYGHAAAPGGAHEAPAPDETQPSRFSPPSAGCDSARAAELDAESLPALKGGGHVVFSAAVERCQLTPFAGDHARSACWDSPAQGGGPVADVLADNSTRSNHRLVSAHNKATYQREVHLRRQATSKRG
jgi:hypothetical protein